MDITLNALQQGIYDQFSLLKKKVDKERAERIRRRLARNPSPTTEESILGAFAEMYEPHLFPFIRALLKKGYVMEPTSGFCGKCCDGQAMNGSFPIDEIVINKLAKIGVKVQKGTRMKALKFWLKTPDLNLIKKKYQQIVNTLPPRKEPIQPSQTPEATEFRRTYVPENSKLKRKRLFEILMYNILESMAVDVKKRIATNPKPTSVESNIGVFVEMLEPQVRSAVLELNRKGYTTDVSGFMGQADSQIIDGDFTIDETVQALLRKEGVTIETNHSGYTRLQFWPEEADITKIRKKWDKLVSLFPNKGVKSSPSMTSNARLFRRKY